MRLRTSLAFLGSLLLSSALSAGQPEDFGGTYIGEVVVRSLSATRVVVALDEEGFGLARRLFFVDTDRPMGPFASRSAVARVEHSNGKLVVTVPSEGRCFLFEVPSTSRAARQGREQRRERAEARSEDEFLEEMDLLETFGLEAVRIQRVVQLAQYGLSEPVALADVESGEVGDVEPRAPLPIKPAPQNPDPLPGDGSGCRTSCSTGCGDGSACNITCKNGNCASCDCVSGHGASCACS